MSGVSKKVQALISGGESETTEFKTAFNRDVIETAVAFANTRGDTILIGVSDDGGVVGTTCGDESLQLWANEIKQNTIPSITPAVEAIGLKSNPEIGSQTSNVRTRT